MKGKRMLAFSGGAFIGGKELTHLSILKILKRHGWQVESVLNGWNNGVYPTMLSAAKIDFLEIKLGWFYIKKPIWTWHTLRCLPRALVQCGNLLRRHSFIYTTSYCEIFILARVYNLRQKCIIMHMHEELPPNSIQEKLFRSVSTLIHHYICVSYSMQQHLVQLGIHPGKITVIQNCFASNNHLEPGCNFSKGIRLGIVGQVLPHKGHAVLLKAYKVLQDAGYRLHLLIIGNGNAAYIQKLRHFVQQNKVSNVFFKAYQEDLPAIYQQFDLLVAPTLLAEPFGRTVIEANFFNRPVIASNKGGFKETVIPGYNGFLVEPDSVQELADSIAYFCHHPAEIRRMGINGNVHVARHFSPDQFEQKIVAAFESFL